jgi:transposase
MNLQSLLQENTNLRHEITLLNQQNTSLNQQNTSLGYQLQQLKEQLAWLQRQLFGQRSEKIIDHASQLELDLPDLGELLTEFKEQKIASHTRKKVTRSGKDKITLPENLPVETQILDISQEQKICPKTGKDLVRIGEEITRKLAHKPGSYYIKEIIRPKYALPGNEGILTQELPESILPRSGADESLLAEIFTKKFADHLPIYRICEGLAREGIGISRQLLSQWVLRCGQMLKPLYKELEKQILQASSIYVDETPIDMQKPGKGKVQQAYMWVIASGGSDPPYRLYHFKSNRKHENAEEILKGYQGVVHSDKYGAYENLANQKKFVWCPCFAHIRRKFFEAESEDLKFRNWVLRKIRYLFLLEKVAWARSEKERLEIRKNKEEPIINELIEKSKERLMQGDILPKSKLREALGYFCGLIPHLKNYIYHPNARIENNTAERAIRPLAIGRKNWLFVGSETGGEAAAIILSLVQSCRASGVNPREYLEDVMRRLMSHSNQKLHELLPIEWAQSKNLIIRQPG